MQTKSAGVFQVNDGETITITIKVSDNSSTLFGVNYSIFGGGSPLKAGQPLQIKMDKSKAQGGSFIANAKSTNMTLLFSFSSDSGGKYDWTVSGDAGGNPYEDDIEQTGKTPEARFYTFHIV
jgi:hypothetical protein